jgi:eukaryotic-like serine/threonine-protein kinase
MDTRQIIPDEVLHVNPTCLVQYSPSSAGAGPELTTEPSELTSASPGQEEGRRRRGSGIVRRAGRDGSEPRVTVPGDGPLADARAGADALIGRTEQGLHIERLVAEGGMGAVYAASVLATGERVALKVLHRAHAGDAGLASRFAREVRFGRLIDHPNVCPVLADGRLADGRPFFLMPLFDGVTLGDEVRRSGPLPLRLALAIADQVLAGLSAMHAARVVHRDLQPDNVLLVREGSTGAGGALQVPAVKLIDLGFAHEPGVDTGDGVTPDSPGSLVGTLRFMSPEQASRSRAINERSDQFAVALLIYYALSGKLPFRGRDELDVLVAIQRSLPVPLRRERRDAPRGLDDLLRRALSKHPDARFSGAAAMRAALAGVAV